MVILGGGRGYLTKPPLFRNGDLGEGYFTKLLCFEMVILRRGI